MAPDTTSNLQIKPEDQVSAPIEIKQKTEDVQTEALPV